jgi:hypothetical protein
VSPKKKGGSRKAEAKRAADFVIALSQHPELKAAWKKDPEGTMKKAGLGKTSVTALKSGDPDAVRKHLGDDAPPGCFIIILEK